jgi:branched-subunit amino acid transport protein
MEAFVNAAWWTVAIVGVATIAIKGSGPVLLGGRPLPPRFARIIGLLAPALLAALVAISTFGLGEHELAVDERALGVGAAAVAVALKAPALLVVIVAAVVTAVARAIT